MYESGGKRGTSCPLHLDWEAYLAGGRRATGNGRLEIINSTVSR